MSTIDAIRNFLKQRGGGPDIDTLGLDESLLDRGVVDSAVMIDLITHLESSCAIQIPEEDMMPENFETLRAIAGYIERRQREG